MIFRIRELTEFVCFTNESLFLALTYKAMHLEKFLMVFLWRNDYVCDAQSVIRVHHIDASWSSFLRSDHSMAAAVSAQVLLY